MSYAECLKKYYNAVDGTFYDAIKAGYVFLFEVIRLFLCGMRALVVIRPGAQAARKKYYLIISRCFSS